MKRNVMRAVAALAMLSLLAMDTAITWHLASRNRTAPAAVPADLQAVDPLDQFRLEREQLIARQEAQLNDIIYNNSSDSRTVSRAQAQLMSLMERREQEVTLEGILQARGFDGALVSVDERSANVLLRREAVTSRESAVILELVMRQTGLTGGNVKIIPVK